MAISPSPSPTPTRSSLASRPPGAAFTSPPADSELEMSLLPDLQNQQAPRLVPKRARAWTFLQRLFSGGWTSSRRHLNRLDDGWGWEVSSMMLSVSSTIATIVILGVYNGRQFPTIPGDISLNAVVSTLSTVSKSSLMFSVSAVLGQLKWDWYEKSPRGLQHLETFAKASKGPLGAAKLLFGRQTIVSTASIGAIITVLALAIDPSLQQVIGTAEKVSFIESDEAWTERPTRPSFFRGIEDSDYVAALNGAIYWNDIGVYDRRAHCPSGDCQFESFETVEFCVDSGIVTDLTTIEWECSAEFDMQKFEAIYQTWKQTGELGEEGHSWSCKVWFGPNKTDGYYSNIVFRLGRSKSDINLFLQSLEGEDDFQDPRFTIELPTSIIQPLGLTNPTDSHITSMVQVRSPLIGMGSVRFSSPPEDSYDFRDVKLEWAEWAVLTLCKITRAVSVVNGSTTSTITDTGPIFGAIYENPSDDLGDYIQCWTPNSTVKGIPTPLESPVQTDPRTGGKFTADPASMAFCAPLLSTWQEYMTARLTSEYLESKTIARLKSYTSPWTALTPEEGFRRENGSGRFETGNFAGTTSEDIHQRVQNHTLGAVMRTMAAAMNNISLARSDERITGSVKVLETVVKIRWAWLTLPLLLEALGLVLLLAVNLRRRRVAGLWKDSLLAVVYNGLDREDDALFKGRTMTMTDINAAARAARVRLEMKATYDGGKVVLASA